MDNIITATGKAAPCNYCVLGNNSQGPRLTIRSELSMQEAAMLFSNPIETCSLTYGRDTYEGYSKLSLLVQENMGIRVVLEQE